MTKLAKAKSLLEDARHNLEEERLSLEQEEASLCLVKDAMVEKQTIKLFKALGKNEQSTLKATAEHLLSLLRISNTTDLTHKAMLSKMQFLTKNAAVTDLDTFKAQFVYFKAISRFYTDKLNVVEYAKNHEFGIYVDWALKFCHFVQKFH